MLDRCIAGTVLPADAERDLVLNRVGNRAEAVDQVGRPCPREIGPDRRIAAGDVEPDADDGDLFAIGGDAANRHDVAHVTIGHERGTLGAAGNVLELCERLSLVFSKDSKRAHGGNPIASLTAAYSGYTRPSAARMISGGSIQVRSRMGSGKSARRIITNSPMSGASPSLNTTGRRRTMTSPAF